MKIKRERVLIISEIVIIFIIVAIGVILYLNYKSNHPNLPIEKVNKISHKPEIAGAIKVYDREKDPTTPSSNNLNVPYVSQAPFGVWDKDHNEACEETAVLMAVQYLKGDRRANIDPKEANDIISNMIAWQRKNLGGHHDLTAEQTINYLVKQYFKMNAKVVKLDLEEIKRELFNGKPVIVPFYGRDLQNPYYKRPGPVYHMMLIRGYENNGSTIITNDPGTYRIGINYKYSWEIIEKSAHNWMGTDDKILDGPKVMIVFE